jgi:CRP/FNR family cyclic AMP-dependent transcriptional regulator
MSAANAIPTLSLHDALRAAPWYAGLDETQRHRVEADTIERVIACGAFVTRRGDVADQWMGVIDGLLKMSNVSPEGKLATFAGMPSGARFGEGTLLKKETRKYDVVALRETRVACMPIATFDWLLERSLSFNRFLLDHLNERLGQFIAMVEYDRLLDPDARVARCLASMVHPLLYPATGNALRIGQEEIGNLAGVSRQRVNQALQRLEGEHLLAIEYGAIRIIDLAGLAQFGS